MSKNILGRTCFSHPIPAPLYCTELHKDSISGSRAGKKKSRTDQHKRLRPTSAYNVTIPLCFVCATAYMLILYIITPEYYAV
jgi:hypothetical protein